jgi:activator of HSP90 ATPase
VFPFFPAGGPQLGTKSTTEETMNARNHKGFSATIPSRRQIILGAAAALGGSALPFSTVSGATGDEILRNAESIHQEPVFKASPARFYEALMNAAQFDKVTKLSDAMQSGAIPKNKPTQINPVAGGAFTLFGGYITGRNIELVPAKRIVQAWRPGDWAPGVYSIVKFELVAQDSGTKIIFDHTGFPQGTGEHLAEGWHDSYWNPLVLFLATPT